MAPSLHMVELRKVGGDTLEFHKVYMIFMIWRDLYNINILISCLTAFQFSEIKWQFYKNFSTGLEDIVWTTEQNQDEKKWAHIIIFAGYARTHLFQLECNTT